MQQVKKESDGKKLNNIIPFIPEGDFYFAKGVESFRKRKFDVAIKWLQKAIEADPNEPLYGCQMSIIYTEIGSFHKANQLLTNILQSTDDQYVDCYYLLANNYAHLGLLYDAKKYALAYIEREPDGDFSEEAKSLLELIEIDEEDEWDSPLDDEDELLIYQETVFYHMENLEWEKALPLLKEMLTLFPEHKMPLHEYSFALFFTGKTEKAIEMENSYLDDDPNSLYSHTNLALFYSELGMKEEYENHIRTLLNIYPIHEQQKLRIAITMARTGYFNEAYTRFRMLSKGAVSSHLSYYRWYSYTLYHLGYVQMAESLWQEGCKKHTNLKSELKPWQL